MTLGGLLGAYAGVRLFCGFCRLHREAVELSRARTMTRPPRDPRMYGGRIAVVNGRLRVLDSDGRLAYDKA